MPIAENIALIRERITNAARRAGRDSRDISLMAVTKTIDVARIRDAYEAGIRLFGENKVQEFQEKSHALRALPDFRCHMIGHLQSNKARNAAELFDGIDSVDSLRLARKLSSAAQELGKVLPVLIEINIGNETSKSGFRAGSAELEELLQSAPNLALSIGGLMAVPPFADDPEASRPYFRKLRGIFEQVKARRLPGIDMQVLSMGMSHDFEVAIAEGATCVRVGSAIFGERPRKADHP